MYSSKCQKKPRWSEFRDSVFTVFTQRSQPLAPSVDICLHMYEQRRVELQQCSAAVYSVCCSAATSCRTKCGFFPDPQYEDFIPQSCSSSQARLLEAASSPTDSSLPPPTSRSWKSKPRRRILHLSMPSLTSKGRAEAVCIEKCRSPGLTSKTLQC